MQKKVKRTTTAVEKAREFKHGAYILLVQDLGVPACNRWVGLHSIFLAPAKPGIPRIA